MADTPEFDGGTVAAAVYMLLWQQQQLLIERGLLKKDDLRLIADRAILAAEKPNDYGPINFGNEAVAQFLKKVRGS